MALLRALEQTQHSHLYSDCQEVIDNFEVIQHAVINHLPCPILDHSDIWGLTNSWGYGETVVRSHPLYKKLAEEYKARKRYKQQYSNYVKCLCALAEETFRILSTQKIKTFQGVFTTRTT